MFSEEMFSDEVIKENLALSFIASSGKLLTEPTPSMIYEYAIESLRRSELVEGEFEIVWGPAVLKADEDGTGENRQDDYVIYMAKNLKNPDDFRVAIRGTVTPFDAVVDLDINQVEWNSVYSNSPSGLKISEGASIASNTIIKGQSNNLPGKGLTLFDFINTLSSQSGKGIDITFTGHSLGGCLAMTLALYYKLRFIEKESSINKSDVKVHCCTFAAPTAGGKMFVDYAAKIFNGENESGDTYQSKFLRVFNTNDLVPCAWVSDELRRFRNLYDDVSPVPENIKKFVLDSVVSSLDELPAGDKYTQPNLVLMFSFPLTSETSDWKVQVGYQHGDAYPGFYNLISKDVDLNSKDVEDIIIVVK